jgi:hypothetical protein
MKWNKMFSIGFIIVGFGFWILCCIRSEYDLLNISFLCFGILMVGTGALWMDKILENNKTWKGNESNAR